MSDESDPHEAKVLKAIGDRFKNEPGIPISDHYLAETTYLHPATYLGALYRLRYADPPYIEADEDFMSTIVEDGGKVKDGQWHDELLKVKGLTPLGWARYRGIPPARGKGFTNA